MKNSVIEKRLEQMWDNTRKYMEAGTWEENMPAALEHFSSEILPLVAARTFFKGVGKLDEEAADTVLKEVGSACGDFALGHMGLRGLQLPTADIDAFLAAHEAGENVATGGLSKVTREGNTATLVMTGGCACPLVKHLQIEPTSNHCLCTANHLKHVYEVGLGRPVEVELLETYLRGGNSCTIRMSWK